MCTLQTGKICYNAININYVLLLVYVQSCKRAQINLPSVMVLRKVVCSLFIPLKVRSALHVDRISQQSYESYIILRNRIVVGLFKSLNQGLWLHILHSDPFHST